MQQTFAYGPIPYLRQRSENISDIVFGRVKLPLAPVSIFRSTCRSWPTRSNGTVKQALKFPLIFETASFPPFRVCALSPYR